MLISGIPEQKWEPYEATKQRIYDTIASAMANANPSCADNALREASSIEISYCTRIGKHRPGYDRPISVASMQHDDKERIMAIKNKLPHGIYINNEYSMHVKQIRDSLRPILRLAKSIPAYKEKSKLESNHLVINGIRYGMEDLCKLPSDLAPFKAAQKEDESYIAFHGEMSPYSNFHRSPFTLNNHQFHSAEQWIQYQKAMLFGDSFTANQILACSTPFEAKRLGYQVNRFDACKWKDEGYDLCKDGISKKFHQNPPLLQMLKTTHPKTLVEAFLDKQWGTGIQLRDTNALNPEKWNNKGWMSSVLGTIRDINL